VGNLRAYIKGKSHRLGLKNVFPVDGLITDLPFPDDFADVVMGGHVFGDEPEAEYQEMLRVTRPGGLFILCPGNNDLENDAHRMLVARGCQWSRFAEPPGDLKRKYWRVKDLYGPEIERVESVA
jgi:SAM-dependent methyltransferase